MKKFISKFKITNGSHFALKDFDADYADGYEKEDADSVLAELIKRQLLYRKNYMPTDNIHY